MIKITNLNKFYNNGKQNQIHAVSNTTLTLPDSGMIAFFGKSGCGKTTLLNIIGGLDKADSGRVEIDSETVGVNTDRVKNQKIGYIFQNYNLSKQMTVYDNVASSLRLCGVSDEADVEKRVIAALRSVEMDKYRKRYPDELSGGQQQRVAIARAIVKNPDVILADEPTGNLDEHNTVMVMDLLKEISREHLVLLVTHEQSLVDLYCDEVIEIADGAMQERRENQETGGYVGKRAGDVYLGDMQKSHADGENVEIECFGEFGGKIKLRLISVKGSLYLSAPDNVKIKFANSSSEIKIHEGKFEAHEQKSSVHLDEALRAPLNANKKCGRIYSFKGALRSSFSAVFGRKKFGRSMLIVALVFFSMMAVLMASLFGASIFASQSIRTQYNTNTLFVDADEISLEKIEWLQSEGYCDNALLVDFMHSDHRVYSSYALNANFGLGHFESISRPIGISVTSHTFPISALDGRRVLCGKGENLSRDEILISQALADKMLSSNKYSGMKSYDRLISMTGSSSGYASAAQKTKIAGVVEGEDIAIYMSDGRYATDKLEARYYTLNAFLSVEQTSIKTPVPDGGAYLIVDVMENPYDGIKIPAIGSRLTLYGRTFVCKGVYTMNNCELLSGKPVTNEGTPIAEDENSDNTYNVFVQSIVLNDKDMYGMTLCSGESGKLFVNNSYFNMKGADEDNYYALHAKDIDGLANYLRSEGYGESMITHDDVYNTYSQSYDAKFATSTITFVVVLAVMCLCLYFIMRSSIMSQVKQLGVYRAIGVSRKNIVFRYWIESLVVFISTIFVGWLVSSYGMTRIMSLMGEAISTSFYYPWYMAAITLALLLGLSVLFGLIPVMSLLRKTPAEILSKYDI